MGFGRGALIFFFFAGCATKPVPRTALDDEPPRIASAFFGLDNALPQVARLICFSAPGKDGIPVTFSRRIGGTIDPAVFAVYTKSGGIRRPVCATTKPASAQAKRHTVLLIGELGDAANDPPESVEITGDLPLEGGANARGLKADIVPLSAGPTLVLGMAFHANAIDSNCPPATKRIISVVWAGGVKPRPGFGNADHLNGYTVQLQTGIVKPFALGDLDDRDNYVHLCMLTPDEPKEVRFAPGILADPNGDLNPATAVGIKSQK